MINNVVIGEASQKPASSAFKQQNLPAWQPILTAGTVLPTLLFLGIVFIPIGGALLYASTQVQEFQLDYTFCTYNQLDSVQSSLPLTNGTRCADVLQQQPGEKCTCKISFTLNEELRKDVFLYYGLSNYYQNHRRYVKSRDDWQLYGRKGALSSDCEPFGYRKDDNNVSKPIAPCGAIANSLFNDSFLLQWNNTKTGKLTYVPIINTGIAWATDKNTKFRNPYVLPGENLSWAFRDTIKPPNWQRNIWYLDNTTSSNNGFENEALIVWMRTAALPNFRKIYGRIGHNMYDTEASYKDSLPKGQYILTVEYNYPVKSFKGTKKFIISNTSWLGGKNPFLGVAYIVVSCICLIMFGVFTFVHKKFGLSKNETLNINQRTPYLS